MASATTPSCSRVRARWCPRERRSTGSERSAEPERGEAAIEIGGRTRRLRPTFAALVAAEEELGPLFALVDRASSGQLRLSELAALFWHCLHDREGVSRDQLGEALAAAGLAAAARPLRAILVQILQGGT